MRVQTTRWVAGSAAAVSVALIAGALVLAYADRHLVPSELTGWNFADVFDSVPNLAVPVVGFVLASRRPANRVGQVFVVAGLGLGLSSFARAHGSPSPTTAPATTPATPRWAQACGTWPTGSPPSAAGSTSSPPPARAQRSLQSCPSPTAIIRQATTDRAQPARLQGGDASSPRLAVRGVGWTG